MKSKLSSLAVLACLAVACAGPTAEPVAQEENSGSIVWKVDGLESVGGHEATVLGGPRVIETPDGRAVEFDGVDDALFVETHPLAGATEFTAEVIFRPDPGGERPVQDRRAVDVPQSRSVLDQLSAG